MAGTPENVGETGPISPKDSNPMNDLSLSEVDFYIVFFVVGSIGILVLALWFTILDSQRRMNRRMQIMSITSLGHERCPRRQRAKESAHENIRV
jgi:hypothetical protein